MLWRRYQQGLYAEKWAPFVKELAVMVVRSRDGSVVSYPVVETIHKDNICHVTEAPADAPSQVRGRAFSLLAPRFLVDCAPRGVVAVWGVRLLSSGVVARRGQLRVRALGRAQGAVATAKDGRQPDA